MISRTNNSRAINYVGFQEFDIDKNLIADRHSLYVENSLTYLEKDINNGDTEIYVNNLNGFRTDDMISDNDGLIFWNYNDSTGYQYPELTYSRNVYFHLFDKDCFDLENNKIILKEPWNNGKIEKGTKLSQSSRGGNYNYGILQGAFQNKYKLYSNYIQGIRNSGVNKFDQFSNGTKYVKILFRLNFYGLENVNFDVKDIIFAECE